MSKFTPGPWRPVIDPLNTGKRSYGPRMAMVSTDAEESTAIDFTGSGATFDESAANAALGAAAPDLYKELAHLVALIEPCINDGRVSIPGLATLNAAHAALAKARGEA
jgi:hypothetical protein